MPLLALILAGVLQAAPAPFETIARQSMSGIDEPRQSSVRTAAEWATLWRAHAGDQPAPRVDFGAKTVLAVFLGTRMSAGYAVEITGVRPEGTGLVVRWSERRPQRDLVTAQVLTSPAHIVAVPKVAGTIRFEKAGK